MYHCCFDFDLLGSSHRINVDISYILYCTVYVTNNVSFYDQKYRFLDIRVHFPYLPTICAVHVSPCIFLLRNRSIQPTHACLLNSRVRHAALQENGPFTGRARMTAYRVCEAACCRSALVRLCAMQTWDVSRILGLDPSDWIKQSSTRWRPASQVPCRHASDRQTDGLFSTRLLRSLTLMEVDWLKILTSQYFYWLVTVSCCSSHQDYWETTPVKPEVATKTNSGK